jgi:hypothetical protein
MDVNSMSAMISFPLPECPEERKKPGHMVSFPGEHNHVGSPGKTNAKDFTSRRKIIY